MIANRYVIAFCVIIALPLITFAARGTIADYANEYIGIFADTSTFEGVVRLTEQNRPTFDILKNGQYEFEKYTVLDTVDDKKLAKYFGGEDTTLAIREAKKRAAEKLAVAPKVRTAKNVNVKRKRVYSSPAFKLTFIYYGETERYAIIDGKFVKQGAKLATGYILEEIRPDKIKVKTPGGVKWFTINI